MIRRRLWAWVAGIVGVTAVVLALNLAFGNTPALGLDLQGGLSVTLAPTEGATDDDLLVIRDLIRDEARATRHRRARRAGRGAQHHRSTCRVCATRKMPSTP